MIQTIKQYAAQRGITTQAVPQLKRLNILVLPIFVEYNGEKIQVDKRKFVITEK